MLNFFSNFIYSNFKNEFFSKYKDKSNEELKTTISEILIEGLSNNMQNENFNFNFIDFEMLNTDKLLASLTKPDFNISSIQFSSNKNLTSEKINDLMKIFSKVPTLKSIFFYNTGLDYSILPNSLNTILIENNIEFLLLSNEKLDDDGFESLSQTIISKCSKLKSLSLNKLSLTSKCLIQLAELFEKSSIEDITISNADFSEISDDTKTKLIQALSNNTHLTHLRLNACNLNSNALLFFEALKNNTKLKLNLLNLNENNINEEVFKEALEKLKLIKLDTLELNNNNINDTGIFYLYDYLKDTYPNNKNNIKTEDLFKFLDLEQNNITDKGAQIVENIIDSDYFYLKNLNIAFNKISKQEIDRIVCSLVEFSQRNESKMNIERIGLDDIFKYLNISQIGVDLRRNNNITNDDYKLTFEDKIDLEFNRFFSS